MTKHSASPTPTPWRSTQTPRAARDREHAKGAGLHLVASGYAYSQIAKIARTSVATMRREIDRVLTEPQLAAPQRFARVQVALLVRALRLAEAAVELGELKAVAAYLRIVAALDRYHELAAGSPPPVRSTKASSRALPGPPNALGVAVPHANDDSTTPRRRRAPRRRRFRGAGRTARTPIGSALRVRPSPAASAAPAANPRPARRLGAEPRNENGELSR